MIVAQGGRGIGPALVEEGEDEAELFLCAPLAELLLCDPAELERRSEEEAEVLVERRELRMAREGGGGRRQGAAVGYDGGAAAAGGGRKGWGRTGKHGPFDFRCKDLIREDLEV
jgi:hypothetical protein